MNKWERLSDYATFLCSFTEYSTVSTIDLSSEMIGNLVTSVVRPFEQCKTATSNIRIKAAYLFDRL